MGKNNLYKLHLNLFHVIFFINLFNNLSILAEYSNCYININEYFAFESYFNQNNTQRKEINNLTSIEEGNNKYEKFISLPKTNNKDILFNHLSIEKIPTEYLKCGIDKETYTICENQRLIDDKQCIEVDNCAQFQEKIVQETITVNTAQKCLNDEKICLNGNQIKCLENCKEDEIELKCDSNSICLPIIKNTNIEYNIIIKNEEYNISKKKVCYPKNHICLSYKEKFNKYYYIDDYYFNNSNGNKNKSEKFYLYVKNVIQKSKKEKNCDLDIFSCDFKVYNDENKVGYKHVVNFNTKIPNNILFVKNITSNLGDSAFFKYFGEIKKGKDKIEEDKILKNSYYFKYLIEDTIYYFIKNINTKTINVLCNSYLPDCLELREKRPLYNNSNLGSGENKKARENFYKKLELKNKKVYEENLSFAKNSNFSDSNCLFLESDAFSLDKTDESSWFNDKKIKTKTYCSDLTDDGENLKYPNGIQRLNIFNDYYDENNCYFKSCIDLTPKEIEVISKKGKNKKFCSEYYWLNNNYSFKYLDRDNPDYCSNLQDNKLKFEKGFEISNLKCYLKNCFSTTKEEKKLIIDVKNKEFEESLNWAYNLNNEPNGKEHNIEDYIYTKYCEKGYFFNRDIQFFENLDLLNFNIISCNNFSDEQLEKISTRPIFFTDGFKNGYNTYDYNGFCRTHSLTISRNNNLNNLSSGFLQTTIISNDEKLKESYKNYFNRVNDIKLNELNSKSFHEYPFLLKMDDPDEYSKILYNEVDNSTVKKNKFNNYCSYVDNLFLYNDVEINNLNSFEFFNKFIETGEKIKIKSLNYFNCFNNCFGNASNIKTPPTSEEISDMLNKQEVCNNCKINNTELTKELDCYNEDDNKDFCKREYCELKCQLDYPAEKKYFDISNIIKQQYSNCNSFNSIINKNSGYFDCNLYVQNDNFRKNLKENTKDIFNDIYTESIKNSCEDLYKTVPDLRPKIEPDVISKLIKPYLISNPINKISSNFNNKNTYQTSGCSFYNIDKEKTNFNLKIPKDDSIYLSNTSKQFNLVDKNYIDNKLDNYEFLVENKDQIDDKLVINKIDVVNQNNFDNLQFNLNSCIRVPDYNNKCGLRNNSEYNDKCLILNLNNKITNKEKKITEEFFLKDNNKITNTKITSYDYGRNVYFSHNILTNEKTFAFNNKNEHTDRESRDRVGLECGLGDCSLAWLGGPLVYAFCLSMCIGFRVHEFDLKFQNSSNNWVKFYDYNENGNNNETILTPVTIINNDNYIYNYYPRSTNIENDLQNKLYFNKKTDKKFFHNTTNSYDIIKACGLENFIKKPEVDCLKKQEDCVFQRLYLNGGKEKPMDPWDHPTGKLASYWRDRGKEKKEVCRSCKFNITKYKDEDGAEDGICLLKQNMSECLGESKQKCLDSFGVKILDIISDINDFEQIVENNSFLSQYQDGFSYLYNRKEDFNKIDSKGYIPVNLVFLTKSKQTEEELKTRKNCELTEFGDPKVGNLEKCRGFEYNGIFYTESQAFKKPLLSSPFFFFNLVTPNNIPELFDPRFYLKTFTKYDGKEYEANKINNKILNFFNPKLQFDYAKLIVSISDTYGNLFVMDNKQPKQEILSENRYSFPYELKYQTNSEKKEEEVVKKYKFIFEKTFRDNGKGASIPLVCVHRVADVKSNTSQVGMASNCLKEIKSDVSSSNIEYKNTEGCSGKNSQSCLSLKGGRCVDIIETDVYCYDREAIDFQDLVIKQDENIHYLYPAINVYLKPRNISNFVDFNIMNYAFTHVDNANLANNIKPKTINAVFEEMINMTQGYKLTFERSECSKMYFNYYKAIDFIEKQKKLSDSEKDFSGINKNEVLISAIETVTKPYCNQLNGYTQLVLDNESTMKALKNTNNISEVVYKKMIIVQKNPESYGGFNESCMSQNDFDNIVENTFIQKNTYLSTKVLAFKSSNPSVSKTKCLLTNNSLRNKQCLVSDEVYVFCESGTTNCEEKFNVTQGKYSYVRKVNCINLLKSIQEDDNFAAEFYLDDIKACYKGGYNQFGTIYKNDTVTKDNSCFCMTLEDKKDYNTNLFTVRDITLREYGLCIDLKKPDICPAVKYYDDTQTYIDDNLALGKLETYFTTTDENETNEVKQYKKTIIKQHLWRTTENQFGIIPSVFYNKTLGNAEFEDSVYCHIKDKKDKENLTCNDSEKEPKQQENCFDLSQCLGGEYKITGNCVGYWKDNGLKKPEAICSKVGDNLYEYKLVTYKDIDGNDTINTCVRYQCPAIGLYNRSNWAIDEKDIINNTSDIFKDAEVFNYFSSVNFKDFNIKFNDEESTEFKLDTRGSENGFAIWNAKDSDDYSFENIAKSCLTGYGPASANYIKNDFLNNLKYDFDIDYNNLSSFDSSNSNNIKFIEYNKEIIKRFNEELKLKLVGSQDVIYRTLPNRICNQKGNWQIVNDIYNNQDYFSKIANRYFYIDNKTWLNSSSGENNGFLTEADLRNVNKYCERLFCKKIDQNYINNQNIYDFEYLNKGEEKNYNDSKGIEKDKTQVWNHSGGALWDTLSAPRNSSDVLDLISEFDKSNKNLKYILSDEEKDILRSRYKYLKKVGGLCNIEHGYYNRGSLFEGDNFLIQLANISGQCKDVDKDKNGKYHSQNYSILIENKNEKKPERFCNSSGIWTGIKNNCFRVCEIMDIYHMEYSDEVLSKALNKEIRVNNHDIISFKVNINNQDREDRFKKMKLDSKDLINFSTTMNGFAYGDYLMGGAYWARSIVTESSPRDKNYKNLRYIEVEGNCDSSYDIPESNEIRTYTKNPTDKKPKRRCYEDGTWGPVDKDTLCILAKECKTFDFTLLDLAKLIKEYNKIDSTLLSINNILAGEIAYDPNKIDFQTCAFADLDNSSKFIQQCLISIFESNGSFDKVLTETDLIFSIFAGFGKPEKQVVCNKSNQVDFYKPGWNLMDKDIGIYFKPKTCGSNYSNKLNFIELQLINRSVDVIKNNNINNRTHYVKESNLSFVFDYLYKKDLVKYFNLNLSSNIKTDITVSNDMAKNINIGSKEYNSYQIGTYCNIEGEKGLFFNIMNNNELKTNDNNYLRKNIILECLQNNKNTTSFNTYFKENGNDTIKLEDCLIKTCGGVENNIVDDVKNHTLQSNWTMSIVKEFNDASFGNSKNDSTIKNSISKLNCDTLVGKENNIKYAFVVKGQENVDLSGFTFYEEYNGKLNGYVKEFKSTCSVNKKNLGMINNQTLGVNSYKYVKNGELDSSVLHLDSIKFCTSIQKNEKECFFVTEEEVMNGPEFLKKYCVPMACSTKGIVLDVNTRKVSVNNKLSDNPNAFNLNMYDNENIIRFNDVYILEALKDDYNKNFLINEELHVYGPKLNDSINKKLCGNEKIDIYNKGIIVFDYNSVFYPDYILRINDIDSQLKAIQCFNNLANLDDSLSSTFFNVCSAGYEKNGGICIKYNDKHKQLNEMIKYLKDLKISSFKVSVLKQIIDSTNKHIDLSKNIYDDLERGNSTDLNLTKDIIEDLNNKIKKEQVEANKEIITKITSSLSSEPNNNFVCSNILESNYQKLSSTKDIHDESVKIYTYFLDNEQTDFYIEKIEGSPIKYYVKWEDKNNICISYETLPDVDGDENIPKEKTEIINKVLLIPLDNYLQLYKTKYELKINLLKNNNKQNLTKDIDNIINKKITNSKYEDIINELLYLYKMDNFFRQDFRTTPDKNENKDIITLNIEYFNNFIYNLIIEAGEKNDVNFNLDISDDSQEIKELYLVYSKETEALNKEKSTDILQYSLLDKNKLVCKKQLMNNNPDSETLPEPTVCSEDEKFSLLNESLSKKNNFFQAYYYRYQDLLEKKQEENKIEETDCLKYYKEFIRMKQEFLNKAASEKKNFNSGFFIPMRCDMNGGWVILDSPKCVKRCSNTQKMSVNPNGLGNYDIKVIVEDLRYKKSFDVEVGAFRSQANCAESSYKLEREEIYKKNKLNFYCEDEGNLRDIRQTGLFGDDGKAKGGIFKYSGWAWKIHCIGKFSAFGYTSLENVNWSDHFFSSSRSYKGRKADTLAWKDIDYTQLGYMCYGDYVDEDSSKPLKVHTTGESKGKACPEDDKYKYEKTAKIQYEIIKKK